MIDTLKSWSEFLNVEVNYSKIAIFGVYADKCQADLDGITFVASPLKRVTSTME